MAKAPKKKKAAVKKAAAPKAKKRAAPRARQQQTITEGDYIATLEFNNEKYEANGTSSLESFQNLAASVPKQTFKTRGILTLTFEGRESSQIFFVLQLRRFLFNFTAMQIWAKRLEAALK